MKIMVDEMPRIPSECLFGRWDCEYGWMCRIEYEKCKDAKECTLLKEEKKDE